MSVWNKDHSIRRSIRLMGKPRQEVKREEKKKTQPLHRILFTEVTVQDLSTIEEEYKKGVIIKIGHDMYTDIVKGPIRSVSNESEGTSAAVFGRRAIPPTWNQCDFKEYEYVGSHGGEVASTGFLDVDKAERLSPKKRASFDSKYIGDEYFLDTPKYMYDWNDRAAFARLYKDRPWIIWIGETTGGDSGASLYVRRDKKSHLIDSILVDNGTVFRY